MNSNDIKSGFYKLICDEHITHAMTLKPNSKKVGSAGPVFRITSGDERFQLTAHHHGLNQRTESFLNCNFSDKVLFEKLYKYHGLLDRKLVGRRYCEPKYDHLRTKIIAVAEGNDDTGHLHCAIRVHETRLPKFKEMFPGDLSASTGKKLWNKVSVGGTLEVKEISDLEGWAAYMTKSLFGNQCSDRVKILPE